MKGWRILATIGLIGTLGLWFITGERPEDWFFIIMIVLVLVSMWID